jgi:hypothetical protein
MARRDALARGLMDERGLDALLPNVEWGGYDAGATVAAKLRELGARTIGLVCVNSTWGVGAA